MEYYYKLICDQNNKIEDLQVKFLENLNNIEKGKTKKLMTMTNEQYEFILNEYKVAKDKLTSKTSHEYHIIKKYDLMKVGEDEILVPKIKNIEEAPRKIVTREKMFDILIKTHIDCGHGRRDKMLHLTKKL